MVAINAIKDDLLHQVGVIAIHTWGIVIYCVNTKTTVIPSKDIRVGIHNVSETVLVLAENRRQSRFQTFRMDCTG